MFQDFFKNMPTGTISLISFIFIGILWVFNELMKKDLIKFNKNLRKITSLELDKLKCHPLLSNIDYHFTVNLPKSVTDYLVIHHDNYRTAICLTATVVVQVLTIKEVVHLQLARIEKNLVADKSTVVTEIQKILLNGNNLMYERISALGISNKIIVKFLSYYGFIYKEISSQIETNAQHADSYYSEIYNLLTILDTYISTTVGLYHGNLNIFNGDISKKITDEDFGIIIKNFKELLNRHSECTILSRCI